MWNTSTTLYEVETASLVGFESLASYDEGTCSPNEVGCVGRPVCSEVDEELRVVAHVVEDSVRD